MEENYFIRIVKMEFQEDKIAEFLANFNQVKNKIRASKGCKNLELFRDKNKPNTFFTYSFWQSEQELENYRNSDLFKTVWAKTKPLFNAKPLAWSVDRLSKN
ncbi:MAG TPA: antibiotic biosynthesis monooxygenase [Flavobacteriia bacterium]|jgi:quinol monooxygenase YgiN|nr:antibiotic biosynthesis monooxygenase [Flavobacteriia bacterium]